MQHRGFVIRSLRWKASFLPPTKEVVDFSRFSLHKFTVRLFHFRNDASRNSVERVPDEKLLMLVYKIPFQEHRCSFPSPRVPVIGRHTESDDSHICAFRFFKSTSMLSCRLLLDLSVGFLPFRLA